MKICLSIGHSEDAQGAMNQTFDVSEFQYNTGLAVKIAQRLMALHHDVAIITRDSLDGLPSKINETQAAIAVELHCNAFNKITSGTEVLHYPTSTKGAKLAQLIQDEIVDVLQIRDRGIKPSGRELILRKTVMPCVIVESFFIDNDLDYLIGSEMIEELADAISNAVHQYSLLSKY